MCVWSFCNLAATEKGIMNQNYPKPLEIKRIKLDPSKKRVSVFGNSLVDKDSISIRILPELRKRFPHIEFLVEDPTETLNPPDDEWWIIDAAEGVKRVELIEDLTKIEPTQSTSVHDYDLSFDLFLLQKLGKLPKMKIVIVPFEFTVKKAVKEVTRILKASGF